MWRSTRLLIGGIATLISPLSKFARHLSATISQSRFVISQSRFVCPTIRRQFSTDMVLVPQGGRHRSVVLFVHKKYLEPLREECLRKTCFHSATRSWPGVWRQRLAVCNSFAGCSEHRKVVVCFPQLLPVASFCRKALWTKATLSMASEVNARGCQTKRSAGSHIMPYLRSVVPRLSPRRVVRWLS